MPNIGLGNHYPLLTAIYVIECATIYRNSYTKTRVEINIITHPTSGTHLQTPRTYKGLPIPGLVLDILSEARRRRGGDPVPYKERTEYSKQVSVRLKEWNTEIKVSPKDLRKTLPSEALKHGWYGYEVRRYLGHAPSDITERSYIAQSRGQIEALLRDRVTLRIDEVLEPWRAKWQQNGNDPEILTLKRV